MPPSAAMMRVSAVLVGLTAAVVACGSAPGTTRTDVDAYLKQADAWAPVEAETARAIDRILQTQFVDEAEVRHQIADNRPRIVAHLAVVRAYHPHVDALAAIHQRYVAAWERLLGGYDAIERGFTSGDYTQLARGREAMAAWRDGLVGVAKALRDLRQGSAPGGGDAVESRVAPPAPQVSTHKT